MIYFPIEPDQFCSLYHSGVRRGFETAYSPDFEHKDRKILYNMASKKLIKIMKDLCDEKDKKI